MAKGANILRVMGLGGLWCDSLAGALLAFQVNCSYLGYR